MTSPTHSLPVLLACLLPLVSLCPPALAEVQEGVVERWGELFIQFKEPVVTRTVVENCARLSRMEAMEELRQREEAAPFEDLDVDDDESFSDGDEEDLEDEVDDDDDDDDDEEARPTPEDCGLTLFSVSSNPAAAPAPRLRWTDQNKLSITFAPGSSPSVEYSVLFKPGTTYLGGAPLATAAFRFRCKPAGLQASWLPEHAGGAALVSACQRDTLEAQQVVEKHEGLRVCFRRLRHVPMVGWVCTGTVPASLRPATLADGMGEHARTLLDRLLSSHKPEALSEGTPLPQCLVALPQQPLVPGARYELGVEAAPGSGFESGEISLGELTEGLRATLERELVQEEGSAAPVTRLKLSFNHPVPESQLRALWEQLALCAQGTPATRQADGSLEASVACGEGGQPAALRVSLRGLIPWESHQVCWRAGRSYKYSPKGCAQGLEMDVATASPMELCLSLPEGVCTRHGLAYSGPRELAVSVSPTAPVLVGNGCNYVPLRGQHSMCLPMVNVGAVQAKAYHWQAADAARLLPLIQHGMRDDTVACELWQRLSWLRRRASEGLSTEGWNEDARTEAGRALKLLQQERRLSERVREQALAAATAFEAQPLVLKPEGRGLQARGQAELNLDALTGGQVKPGLYLISLCYSPSAEVEQALLAYGMKPAEAALPCAVDFLVQVTDLNPRRGRDRILVNSLTSGQPLEGVQATLYKLPASGGKDTEQERLASALEEAAPVEKQPVLHLKQGQAQLPAEAENKLLLLQRGEDYTLLSLWGEQVDAPATEAARHPMLELFCDRPLYRPGETAHLRGVLRRPVTGGLALPRSKRATLSVLKPSGEVMETQELAIDAFGAFAADVSLPAGEEDVTGRYRCRVQVEENGKSVEEQLALPCEVFRRDAFRVKMDLDVDPVAPRQYKVTLQATDYNGSPLAGGKVELELSSTAPLRDEAGNKPEGLKESERYGFSSELEQELVLDAEGRASVSGCFGRYEEREILNATASVSNDREEYMQVPRQYATFSPADVEMGVNENKRLVLWHARRVGEEGRVLDREQVVELTVFGREEKRHELPCGIWYEEKVESELGRHRIVVPANCREGVELRPWVELRPDEWRKLTFCARDPQGRLVREQYEHHGYRVERLSRLSLEPEGGQVRLSCHEAFPISGKLHAFIGSQSKCRHALVEVPAGAKEALIPLTEAEYGVVSVTLVGCEKDAWGTCTKWNTVSASCERPRPDKALAVEFSLPAGARPGDTVTLSGKVLGADGKPVKAAVTLFAVDAGMMSVRYYELPELAMRFYRGMAHGFSLAEQELRPCELHCLTLPNVWTSESVSWYEEQREARSRSLIPAGMMVGSWGRHELGGLFRSGMSDAVRFARSGFRWGDLLDWGAQMQCEAAPAAMPVTVQKAAKSYGTRASKERAITNGLFAGGLRSGSGALMEDSLEDCMKGCMEDCMEEGEALSAYSSGSLDDEGDEGGGMGLSYRAHALAEQAPLPRLRSNFEPVALWLASLETAEDGSFTAECRLPDTLTTYKVYALALGADGGSFGRAESEFVVNQELMLTAGTPFFMSCGDKLLLPLTVTNNRQQAGEWEVTLEGAGQTQSQRIQLEGRRSGTLYFEVTAGEEGECVLRWTARSADGADAVEGKFPVRYPAPLLKEAHRLVLTEGAEAVQTAALLAEEVASATRGELELSYSTSPLIHLSGSVDFLLAYPYGCTEQRSSALLPWIYYEHLAPFCPQMAMSSAEEARKFVNTTIEQLLARQQEDGGLSYWAAGRDERSSSCAWASAYAALVFTLAEEQGFEVPGDAMKKLRDYLGRHNWHQHGYLTQYAVARACGRSGEVNRILVRALKKELEDAGQYSFERNTVDLEFMATCRSKPGERHEALLSWLRSKGRDYRHRTSWSGGWTLIALAEYLRLEPKAAGAGSLWVNGQEQAAAGKPGYLRFKPAAGQSLRELAPELRGGQGSCYVCLRVKAQPEQTEYPGVTEKGLQVTRVYEVQDEKGQWREAREFAVGDIVRVTLTCAKIADELEYFVLEDYLPACMEAINPNVPSQAVGLEDGGWGVWSRWFDHKEYLADRVRGFCTRWCGRDLVNMSYYARVKRAGESTAAPASAQLMYEPQTYGLSPNARLRASEREKRASAAR